MSNELPIDETISSNEDEENINNNNREILVDNEKNFTKIYYALKYGKDKKKNKSVETERKKEDFFSLINSTIKEKDYISQRKNSISKERKNSINNPPKKSIIMTMTDSKNTQRRQSKFMNPKTPILEFDFNYENNSNQKNSINEKDLTYTNDENKNNISTIDKVIDSSNNINNLKIDLETSIKNSIDDSQKNIILNLNNSTKKNSEKKNPSSLKKLINNTRNIKPNNNDKNINKNNNKNNFNNYNFKNDNNDNINNIKNNKNKNITEIKNDNFLFIEENNINQKNEKLSFEGNNNKKIAELEFIKRSKEYEKKRQYHLEKMRSENFIKEMLNMQSKPLISTISKNLYHKKNKKPLYENNRMKDIKSGKQKFKNLVHDLEKNISIFNRNNSANVIVKNNISKKNNDFYYKEIIREKRKQKSIEQLKENKTISKYNSSKIPINKISQLINEGFNYNNLSVTQRLNDDSQIRHFLKPLISKYFPILKKKELKKSSSVPKLYRRMFIFDKNTNKIHKTTNNNRKIITNKNLNKIHFDLFDKMNEERIHWSKKLKLLNKGRNKNSEDLYKINIREDGAWNVNTMNELYFGLFNHRFINSVINDYNLLENEE